ncbi:PREDICTED: uncharacterized protein LOC109186296 [Ipomoea nil]|uniref:uncharacterized protein LOC109186296 n=1 Tax=Ipomoea nil TaxID=35883 RepID=UPI000901A070|nr:PREDICTED: uncharacterized protein LOC109186296 [Ipomoea nil]
MSSHQHPMSHAKDSDGIAAAFEHLPKASKGWQAAEVTKTTVKVYFRDQENSGVENKPYGGVGGGASSPCCHAHGVANNMHGCPNWNGPNGYIISCPNCGYFPLRFPQPEYWGGFVPPPPWVALGVPVPSAPPLPDDHYSSPPSPPPPGTDPLYMMFNDDNTRSICTIM